MTETDLSRLRGSICALITPLRDGDVDTSALSRIVAWHLEQGTHGLVPCGTTGESPVLSDDEWELVVKTCVDEAGGKIPVIPGTGSYNTAHVIERTKLAKKLGAEAALIVTPYYNKPDQAGLLAHYSEIHDKTDLPIILYNVPGRTNVTISVETMGRLAELPRVVGVKDATGDVARVDRQRAACGPDFIQLSGEDATALGFNAHGGHGCISVTANAAPRECADLQEASLAGNFTIARGIQDRLMPLHDALFCEPSPQPVKYAVSSLGLCREEIRLPLVPASGRARERVDEAFSHLGVMRTR